SGACSARRALASIGSPPSAATLPRSAVRDAEKSVGRSTADPRERDAELGGRRAAAARAAVARIRRRCRRRARRKESLKDLRGVLDDFLGPGNRWSVAEDDE